VRHQILEILTRATILDPTSPPSRPNWPKSHPHYFTLFVLLGLESKRDMARETVLGTTTVTHGWKVSLNKDVRAELERDGEPVKVGDRLMYVLREDGEVVIRKPFVSRRTPAAVPDEAMKWVVRDRDRKR
jgi:hypothetical protein